MRWFLQKIFSAKEDNLKLERIFEFAKKNNTEEIVNVFTEEEKNQQSGREIKDFCGQKKYEKLACAMFEGLGAGGHVAAIAQNANDNPLFYAYAVYGAANNNVDFNICIEISTKIASENYKTPLKMIAALVYLEARNLEKFKKIVTPINFNLQEDFNNFTKIKIKDIDDKKIANCFYQAANFQMEDNKLDLAKDIARIGTKINFSIPLNKIKLIACYINMKCFNELRELIKKNPVLAETAVELLGFEHNLDEMQYYLQEYSQENLGMLKKAMQGLAHGSEKQKEKLEVLRTHYGFLEQTNLKNLVIRDKLNNAESLIDYLENAINLCELYPQKIETVFNIFCDLAFIFGQIKRDDFFGIFQGRHFGKINLETVADIQVHYALGLFYVGHISDFQFLEKIREYLTDIKQNLELMQKTIFYSALLGNIRVTEKLFALYNDNEKTEKSNKLRISADKGYALGGNFQFCQNQNIHFLSYENIYYLFNYLGNFSFKKDKIDLNILQPFFTILNKIEFVKTPLALEASCFFLFYHSFKQNKQEHAQQLKELFTNNVLIFYAQRQKDYLNLNLDSQTLQVYNKITVNAYHKAFIAIRHGLTWTQLQTWHHSPMLENFVFAIATDKNGYFMSGFLKGILSKIICYLSRNPGEAQYLIDIFSKRKKHLCEEFEKKIDCRKDTIIHSLRQQTITITFFQNNNKLVETIINAINTGASREKNNDLIETFIHLLEKFIEIQKKLREENKIIEIINKEINLLYSEKEYQKREMAIKLWSILADYGKLSEKDCNDIQKLINTLKKNYLKPNLLLEKIKNIANIYGDCAEEIVFSLKKFIDIHKKYAEKEIKNTIQEEINILKNLIYSGKIRIQLELWNILGDYSALSQRHLADIQEWVQNSFKDTASKSFQLDL